MRGPARAKSQSHRVATLRRGLHVLGLMAGLGGLGLVLRSVDVSELRSSLRGSFNTHVVAGLLTWIVALVFEAYRWQAMLNPRHRVTIFFALKLDAINRLANLFLPFRAGEGLRILATRRQTGLSSSYVLATIVNERLLNILFLGMVASVLTWLLPESAHLRVPVLLFQTAGVVGAWCFLARPSKVRPRSKAKPGIVTGWKSRLIVQFQYFLQGLSILRARTVLFRVVFSSIASACAMWLALYFVLQSYQPTQPALAAVTLLVAMNAATILPLTPSNLGPFQWACILALAVFGVGRTDALAFSLVLMAIRVLAVLIIGLIGIVGPRLSQTRRAALQSLIDSEEQPRNLSGREPGYCEG